MSQPEIAPAIAAVVATKDRSSLLSERSLPSIAWQTRPPEYLIVVDDSSAEFRPVNRKIIEELQLPGSHVRYVENGRTPGASGSWNTAFDVLTDIAMEADLFVAILDDDDGWHPTYLERSYSEACARGLDMVAADFRRLESPFHDPVINGAPESLCVEAFLVGNPGIQGSNIFARLAVLLAAGGFDEALSSTTDRDLCVRITDLGWVRYGRLPEPLVDHFADPQRLRLSSRGSAAKLDGLSAFWRKHAGRMQAHQREAFAERAADLFDWTTPSHSPFTASRTEKPARRFAIVLGMVARHDMPEALQERIRRLAKCRDESLVGLDLVLFEQGEPRSSAPDFLAYAVEAIRDAGAGCFCFTRELQHENSATLALCCEAVARSRPGTEVWWADQAPRVQPSRGTDILVTLSDLGAEKLASSPSVLEGRVDTEALHQWVAKERVVTAEHRVRRRYALGELRVIGSGSEAVVFTDGSAVYKCIDYWKTRIPRSRIDFLKNQVGKWFDVPGLYPLHDVVEDGPWVVLSYEFEESRPYLGGHEHEIIELMNGCSAAGIVCNNVHPKNLVVAPSGVKLIDYGSDIRPWSPLGFEHMARRAFLACHYADHPDLKGLMRRSLSGIETLEFTGYAAFRSRIEVPFFRKNGQTEGESSLVPGTHQPISLYVGVITSDPLMMLPLLRGLGALAKDHGVARLVTVVLDNSSPSEDLGWTVNVAREEGLELAVVGVDRQRMDAEAGAFGSSLRERPVGPVVGIAAARTMLQRYVGALMEEEPDSFAWLLDDDMRVDSRATEYLRWLPAFRDVGLDVLIGAYEGASPNPPLNGLRVQLVDLFHNLLWLEGLSGEEALPDRSEENAVLRTRFPDYYYDLSRRHSAHLEMPHWVEPVIEGETVAEARSRILAGALGILAGEPLTRPIVSVVPSSPVEAAKDSVNRGGNTFVLDKRALTEVPNIIIHRQGREARRSDMIWAILNRYYRGLSVKAVAFPVRHVSRSSRSPRLDIVKVQGEIAGSALYAGLTEFLSTRPDHKLDFTSQEMREIQHLSAMHLERRLRALRQSISRIIGLREAIRGIAWDAEVRELIGCLDSWFSPSLFEQIRDGVQAPSRRELEAFLLSMREAADEYATNTIDTAFIHSQLRTQIG